MSREPLLNPAANVAPQVEEMSRNALNALEPLGAVAVRQDRHWIEESFACCEIRNKYKLSTVPLGLENKSFGDQELTSFPMLFDVRENSTMCCRCCCTNNRAFKLGFFPPGTPQTPRWPETEPLLMLDRPFRCTCWFGHLFCPQQIHVHAEGRKVGRVEQECRCCDFCCWGTHWAKSFNAIDRPVHSFETSFCGRNCCAPSCCNHVFTINIYDAGDETKKVGVIKNIWPGCNWRGLCSPSASNFVIIFPSNATKEDKGLLLGSMFLHDFMFFEKKTKDSGPGDT